MLPRRCFGQSKSTSSLAARRNGQRRSTARSATARNFTRRSGITHTASAPETAVAPAGWEERLVRLVLPARKRDETAVAWCLDTHDLMLAKLAAGRSHDLEFVEEALQAKLVDPNQLRLGLELIPDSHRDLTRERLARILDQLEA